MHILNTSGRIAFWLLFVGAGTVCSLSYYRLFRLIRAGRAIRIDGRFWERMKAILLHVIVQRSILKNVSFKDMAGLGHIIIFWGSVVLAINCGYYMFLIEGLGMTSVMGDTAYTRVLLFVSDIFGILLLCSIAAAVFRRSVIKPARLGPNFDSGIFAAVASAIFIFVFCCFALEGLRINLGIQSFKPPVARAFAYFLDTMHLNQQTEFLLLRITFWLQYLVVLGFLVYAPHSHHKHPLFSPINIFFKSFDPVGTINPVDFKNEGRFGATNVVDLTWKQLLEGFACTHCGRCQDRCPAYITGKPLSPKQLIFDINLRLFKESNNGAPEENPVFPMECLLSCTACGACLEVCPVFNRPLDNIIEFRRGLVYEGIFESGHRATLKRIARDFNPWGVRWNRRAKNLPITEAMIGDKYDCIYWLGCAASFDERAQEIALANIKILNAAGLKCATLGVQEKCCGDFPRRIGDEGLFQWLAQENIRLLQSYNFDFILTHCPHCYNVIKNEYSQFGANFRVMHHSELIQDLLREGKLPLQESRSESRVLYHDPCYLGRYNGVYESPRNVIKALFGDVLEFQENCNYAFCCGAGGGHMWKEREVGQKISIKRLEDVETLSADFIGTACPFCLLMFEEALQIEGRSLDVKVRDIAELVGMYLH